MFLTQHLRRPTRLRLFRFNSTSTRMVTTHFSVGPNGEPVVDLSFASEPLGMPASQDYGWARLDFGQKIGPNERYTIERKLGWGMHSSTWLARDTLDTKFVAVKVLTGFWTSMYRNGVAREPNALRILEAGTRTPHCLRLLEVFDLPGKSTAEGDHICIVTPVYRGDFGSFSYPYVRDEEDIPLPVIKRVVLHTLRGLAYAHACGIVHTDIKRDNIFIDTGITDQEIEDFLVKNPARRHDPEMSEEGIVQSAVSQTFPPISMEEAAKATYLLADFGCAQHSNLHPVTTIIVPPFRPPEVFLGVGWDKPADIWAFGCQIFELLIGKSLFYFQRHKELSEVGAMLWQMATVTGDRFDPEDIKKCSEVLEFFEPDGSFKLAVSDRSVVYCLTSSLRFEGQEELIGPAAAFINRALRIDPDKRASAEELLKDPWFEDVV
ncbi:kinase-like protein [Hymenopellis radicata]|nr:kinase-like protein [Hymenopellis radicata]